MNPRPPEPQSGVLPLHHSHHIGLDRSYKRNRVLQSFQSPFLTHRLRSRFELFCSNKFQRPSPPRRRYATVTMQLQSLVQISCLSDIMSFVLEAYKDINMIHTISGVLSRSGMIFSKEKIMPDRGPSARQGRISLKFCCRAGAAAP